MISKMPLKAWLVTKDHFLSIPGGHSLHTKSISWEGGPCVRPQGRTSCVLGSLLYIYQSSPLVRNFSVTEPHVVLGVNEKIPGFLKLSARYNMGLSYSHSASNGHDGGRKLFGSLSWRRKVLSCLYAAFLALGETSEIIHFCRRV